ncbi:hypothetical protein C900_02094 [Fulvivirga imtechensis AK7]|uniref:Uncharacterized protein n=1 Tax=Fulvivirga imtechensis AK7 TaxID=1237149 RepID=L8JY42_9BACT|nr:hypothetical protein C900_02094 [Fulvivirga imtechensis AK7]
MDNGNFIAVFIKSYSNIDLLSFKSYSQFGLSCEYRVGKSPHHNL